MTALLRFFSFPLLAKELTEAAARRRTYVLRVVYGVALFAVFAAMAPRWLWRGTYDPLSVMGAGSGMFESILVLQFIGIALFLPAMMCGRIAEEKERDSLVLLFLTDLRPWSIVLQKYLGGLVPMLSFLLLAMPLAAIAYAFGGVTTSTLATGLYALLLACLQVGALALMCSAWCRTTVSALMSTYLLGIVFYLGPVLLLGLYQIVTSHYLRAGQSAAFFVHIPPALVWFSGRGIRVTMFANSIPVLMNGIPILISIAVFLLLARVFLVRRAFLPPSHFFLRLFRKLDGLMQRANRITGHRMLLRETRSLPDDDPIAWREMTRKALGKVHYLVRILTAIELPIIAICALASLSMNDYRGQCGMLSLVAAITGTLAVLALSVQAANTIVAERVQQTLEVLLTTPLTAREIVTQKARVLHRFMLVLAVPLLTILGSECYLEWGNTPRNGLDNRDNALTYFVCTLLTIGIFLPLTSWLSLWIGLKMRTRFKAILTALAVIVAWCVLPIIVVAFTENADSFGGKTRTIVTSVFAFLCPLAVPTFNEQSDLHDFPPYAPWNPNMPGIAWLVIAINFTFYTALLLLFRHLALSRADRYLRR